MRKKMKMYILISNTFLKIHGDAAVLQCYTVYMYQLPLLITQNYYQNQKFQSLNIKQLRLKYFNERSKR